MSIQTLLSGHTSEETAYIVDDYPYGFRLRCKIRYWIETSPKKGSRFCSQTTNPKAIGERWNKAKKGNYYDLIAMYINHEGYVKQSSLNIEYGTAEGLAQFVHEFGEVLTSEYEIERIRYATFIYKSREKMHQLALAFCESGNIYDVPGDKRSSVLFEASKQASEELGFDLKSLIMQSR